jgi:hypothetical protein
MLPSYTRMPELHVVLIKKNHSISENRTELFTFVVVTYIPLYSMLSLDNLIHLCILYCLLQV